MNTILIISIVIIIIYLLSKEKMIEVFKTFFFAIVVAILLRSLAYEPFTIPSGSMKPNLLVGDFLFVSKFSYGYSRYSFPYGRYFPIKGRLFSSNPKRGDVAVFKFPGDNKTDYIKRIIGLPGDNIKIKDGIVFVNNEPLVKTKIGKFSDMHRDGYVEDYYLYEEINKQGKIYKVLDDIAFDGVVGISYDGSKPFDVNNTQNYTVPKNKYFVMGDNREHSSDSRILNQVGYVPKENLVGKAALIFLSIEYNTKYFEVLGFRIGKLPKSIRLNRIGKLL